MFTKPKENRLELLAATLGLLLVVFVTNVMDLGNERQDNSPVVKESLIARGLQALAAVSNRVQPPAVAEEGKSEQGCCEDRCQNPEPSAVDKPMAQKAPQLLPARLS